MSVLLRITDPLFWTPPADEHPRRRYTPVNTPGLLETELTRIPEESGPLLTKLELLRIT